MTRRRTLAGTWQISMPLDMLSIVASTAPPTRSPLAREHRHSRVSPIVSLVPALLLSLGVLWAVGCSRSATSKAGESRAAAQQARKAARTKEDIAREELEQIPPPSKSRYLAVRSKEAYGNPFIEVHPDTVTLEIIFPDEKPAGLESGGLLRPVAARRQRVEVLLPDLPNALASLPAEVWPYGRVVGIAEPATEPRTERVAIRRNVEATIQILNDLGVVVDEWSGTSSTLLR
jgi:hypothetical protein